MQSKSAIKILTDDDIRRLGHEDPKLARKIVTEIVKQFKKSVRTADEKDILFNALMKVNSQTLQRAGLEIGDRQFNQRGYTGLCTTFLVSGVYLAGASFFSSGPDATHCLVFSTLSALGAAFMVATCPEEAPLMPATQTVERIARQTLDDLHHPHI